MRPRSALEIQIEILTTALKEHKPTRIMYATNLSWRPLMERFEWLRDQGLLEIKETDDKRRYYVTERGKAAIEQYRLLRAVIGEKE